VHNINVSKNPSMIRHNIRAIFLALSLALTSLAGFTMADSPAAIAAANPNCANGPDPALGTDLITATVPAGTFTVWTRIKADVATDNAYYLQIDCGAPIVVGGSTVTAGAWTWVRHRDGNLASIITTTLTAGSHAFNLTGKSPNLAVDRIILASDAACVPTGTGDNCATAVAPLPGDVNLDNKVDVTDLSLLLSHWNANYTAADFNKDGTVNVLDLSVLLSHWTG
jgi:hypothetical protein